MVLILPEVGQLLDSRTIVDSFPVGAALELLLIDAVGSHARQRTRLGKVSTPSACTADGKEISLRLTDERYSSHWAKIQPDESAPHVIESLRFQCAMDGRRAAWRPLPTAMDRVRRAAP